MSNEENKSSPSSPPAKRAKVINNSSAAKIFTANIAEYKSMVRSLTCSHPVSSGQSSLRVPTQAQVSNPQPIRLRGASIPPGSSGQTSSHLPTQAHVSNHPSIRLYGAPIPPPRNPYPGTQWIAAATSRSFPYPFPPASSEAGPSNAQASSSRPSLPLSPQVPPSVPTMLMTSPPSVWVPPSAPLVPAQYPTLPPSLSAIAPVPPSPPREQGAMEPSLDARMQSVDRFLNEDDDYYFHVPSPFHDVTGTSNGEQQRENAPPPVMTNQPSGSLNVPAPQNGFTMPTWEHGSNSMSENVAPQVHATLPSENLTTGSNSQNGLGSSHVPPPATSQYGSLQGGPNYQNIVSSGNSPPLVAPAGPNHPNDQQRRNDVPAYTTSLPYESQLGLHNPQNGLQQGTVPANMAYGSSSDSPNYPSYEEVEHYLGLIGFGTVPSWHLDMDSYPRVPSLSSTPANLPPGN